MFLTVWLPVLSSALPAYRTITSGNIPKGNPGQVNRYAVTSNALGGEVIADVWLPEGYNDDTSKSYPVVYAHDGQNLFDPAFSFASVAWEMDQVAQSLVNDGQTEVPIIVGINNRGTLRPCDYFPEKALDYIAEFDRSKTKIFETCSGGFFGDEEALFVAKELKPLIDHLFRTNPDASHTFAIGSSMGGLAALYLLCEYPDVFGGAACMSTHWIGSLDLNSDYTMNDDPVCAQAILDYMNPKIPSSDSHRIYLDQGTKGWDASYLKYEYTARQIAIDHGYSVRNGTLKTYDADGADHNEWFWQQRVKLPLGFLLDKGALNTSIDTVTIHSSDTDGAYISLSGLIYTTQHPSSLPSGIYSKRH